MKLTLLFFSLYFSSCLFAQIPNSDWSFATNNLNASFTDLSTGAPTFWLWDFGDGNISTTQNPNHSYVSQGSYTVCLTVSNMNGADSSCQVVTVTCDVPSVDWSFNTNDLNVTFTDLSSNSPNSWLWDFGDGNTSTSQNPIHTYASPGSYTVCLTAVNDCGADSTCQIVTVSCDVPGVDWSFNTSNLNVSFTDLTTNSPTFWLWDFGDGSTSTNQNPNYTYVSPGSYTVCLTPVNNCGADSTCQIVTVSCDVPSVDWSYNVNNLNVTFTDLSSNSPNSWLWDFGDGNTSTSQNPIHNFPSAGSYTVCLTSVNDCGADSTCMIVNAESLFISENDLNQTAIYPNPATNTLIIDLPVNEAEISVYNIDGRIVSHFYTFSEKVNLDVSSFSNGLYVVHMKSGNQYVTKRFVKE